MKSGTTVRALIAAMAALVAAGAVAQDPTVPSGAMAEALRGRIGDLSALRIRALVVGGDNDGVALVGTGDFTGAPIRRDSIVNQVVDGVNVPLSISSVTDAGVKIKTSNVDGGE